MAGGTLATLGGTASIGELPIPRHFGEMRLLALQAQFQVFAHTIDRIVEGRPDPPSSQQFWASFERLITTIENKPATSLAGLRVKAHLATWALMGQIELSPTATIDVRMARSIMRDLQGFAG